MSDSSSIILALEWKHFEPAGIFFLERIIIIWKISPYSQSPAPTGICFFSPHHLKHTISKRKFFKYYWKHLYLLAVFLYFRSHGYKGCSKSKDPIYFSFFLRQHLLFASNRVKCIKEACQITLFCVWYQKIGERVWSV